MSTSSEDKAGGTDRRLHCNVCGNKTWHRLLKEVEDHGVEEADEEYRVWWKIVHAMYECLGCKSVLLERVNENSDWEGAEVQYFPPQVSRHRPSWYYHLPPKQARLLSEIYKSLNADSRSLPMMGARALLDLVLVDKVGDVGNFVEKMKKLETEGFISRKNREILDAALDAGHAAAHRGYSPKIEVVHSVMDIIENLLHAIYVLDGTAEEIKKSTPPRHVAKKKPKP